MILAYLPVKSTLKISLPKLIAWLFPLLIALCILGGILCSALQIGTGIIYNIICILFLLAVWYPATHTVRIMIDDDNFAQIWYVFWILPLIFIRLFSSVQSSVADKYPGPARTYHESCSLIPYRSHDS